MFGLLDPGSDSRAAWRYSDGPVSNALGEGKDYTIRVRRSNHADLVSH